MLFTKKLTAQILWNYELPDKKEDDFLTVPIQMSLRIIGHSFPKNKSWITQIQLIPDVIFLPTSMLYYPCRTTFLIKSNGHLPVTFKLIPPSKQLNFITMKPMVGLIRKELYQIITAEVIYYQLGPFTEQWHIELNGQTERLMCFHVKGQCDIPSVMIGIDNTVEFDNVQPGCETTAHVPIRNTSQFHLQYEFLLHNNTNHLINVDRVKGELAINEENFLNWYFTGEINSPRVQYIICKIHAIQQKKLIIGAPFEIVVTITTHCCYSELCACPKNHDFDQLIYDSTVKTTCCLFNFGESTIHFDLFACDVENNELNDKSITCEPKCGKVLPKSKFILCIVVKANKIGKINISIYYRVKIKEHSTSALKPIQIFEISYEALYPTIQITEIIEHNFGPLFTKLDLWEKFNVDGINQLLSETVQGESKAINLIVPDVVEATINDKKLFHVSFLLKNQTKLKTENTLKRRQLCNCTATQVSKSLTMRQTVLECPHKQILQMEIIESELSIKINYFNTSQSNWVTIGYVLLLSNQRQIEFNIIVNGIPTESNIQLLSSCYKSNYNMILIHLDDTFIGLNEAPLQTFWLYNNSSNAISYQLNEIEIIKVCNKDGFEIIKCLNSNDVIEAYSVVAIIFQFQPIELKTYTVVSQLIYDNKSVKLLITGKGTNHYNYNLNKIQGNMPVFTKTEFDTKTIPIKLSIDHLIIPPFPVWTTVKRLVFIKNFSKTTVFKYFWKPCVLQNFVKIDVIKGKEGRIQPKDKHAIILKITSTNRPCSVRLNLSCRIVDHTQEIIYTQSIEECNNRQKEIEDQFTITETGTNYPINDYIVMPAPEEQWLTLTISINTISSLDTEICFDTQQQYKYSPYETIGLDKCCEDKLIILQQQGKIRTKGKVIRKTMECLIADVLFNGSFRDVVMEVQTAPPPYYAQFKKNKTNNQQIKLDNNNRINVMYRTLKASELSETFNELLCDGIKELFQLVDDNNNTIEQENK